MLQVLISILTTVVLLAASYTDIKTKEVPDWLSYAFLFGIGGIRLIYAIEGDWWQLLGGIAGGLGCWLLGFILYKTGQWGGADTKLLIGVGAAIGIAWPLAVESFLLVWYILLLLASGAFLGLIWIGSLSISHYSTILPAFQKNIKEHRAFHIILGVVTIFLGIITLFISLSQIPIPLLWAIIPFPLATFYLFLLMQVIEQHCLRKKVPLQVVTEGDWLAEGIHAKGKLLLPAKTLLKEDIRLLHEQHIHSITIKVGMPFIPSFLLAYLGFLLSRGLTQGSWWELLIGWW